MSISKIVAYVLETLFKKKKQKTPPFKSSGDGLFVLFSFSFSTLEIVLALWTKIRVDVL